MTSIFAYILHKTGVLDDSAAELITAAKRIDPSASPTAIVSGFGPDLDIACDSLRASYKEVWKISHEAFAYPNAELIRPALTQILPSNCILLLPHEHFGIDLAPGLSVKMNAPLVSDVVAIESDATHFTLVRQEFGGQLSAHVRCDISSGAVITVRPGAFKSSDADASDGKVIDKSSGIGPISAKRRYLQTVVAE